MVEEFKFKCHIRLNHNLTDQKSRLHVLQIMSDCTLSLPFITSYQSNCFSVFGYVVATKKDVCCEKNYCGL